MPAIRHSPERLLPSFGLTPCPSPRPLPAPPGSPERCLERFAMADVQGRAWLLERLGPGQAARREDIARLLSALCARDPELARAIPAYRAVPETGNFVLCVDQPPPAPSPAGHWQLSPLVAHAPLPRPAYLGHAWRGAAVAAFLDRLQAAGATLTKLPTAPGADLAVYRDGLFAAMARHRPELLPRLAPLHAALDRDGGLPTLLAAQGVALVHGDLHPLNILWGCGPEEPLRAVIDWEFAGVGPALYDAANCLGCAAFEAPSGLSGGFVMGLVRGLALSPEQTRLLAAMLPAARLGWLSEWLRKGDEEMLQMELDYLDILLDLGPEKLAEIWLRA